MGAEMKNVFSMTHDFHSSNKEKQKGAIAVISTTRKESTVQGGRERQAQAWLFTQDKKNKHIQRDLINETAIKKERGSTNYPFYMAADRIQKMLPELLW